MYRSGTLLRSGALAHVIFIFLCLTWGSSFILMKKAGHVFGPMTIGSGRVVGGLVLLWGVWVLVMRRRQGWPFRYRDVAGLTFVVLFGYVAPFVLQPMLISRHDNSAVFGMMVALVPLMTALVSIPVLGVRPRAIQMVGIAIGLGCMSILMKDGLNRSMPIGDLALAALVPLGYTTANTYIKRRFSHAPPIVLAATAMSGAALVMVPMALSMETVEQGDTSMPMAIGALAILGLVCTGLATWMFYHLIQTRGPLFAGMVTYIVPMGALAWGWLDDERITGLQMAALGGVLVAVALVQANHGKPDDRDEGLVDCAAPD